MDLREIKRLAAQRFPFDREHYPDFPLEPGDQGRFARRHIQLHMTKNVGQIAAWLEEADHGNDTTPTREEVVSTLHKMLVNAVRFADMSGISLEEIEKDIRVWASH